MDWLLRSPATTPSPARIFFGLAMSTASPLDGFPAQVAVMHGGTDVGTNDDQDDTWVWDDNDWTLLDPFLTGGVKPSPPRQSCPLVWFPDLSEFVLYGGYNSNPGPPHPGVPAMIEDAWGLQGYPPTWHQFALGTGGAGPKGGHAMAYNAGNGTVVLYGGFDYDSGIASDETWTTADMENWTLESPAHSPGARGAELCMVSAFHPSFGDGCLLFGGAKQNRSVDGYGDTLFWDGTDWHDITPGTDSPPGLATPMFADISIYRADFGLDIVLYGGLSGPPNGPLVYNEQTYTWSRDTLIWDAPALVTQPGNFYGFQKQMCANPTNVGQDAHPGPLLLDGILGLPMPTWTWAVPGPSVASIRHTFGLGQ